MNASTGVWLSLAVVLAPASWPERCPGADCNQNGLEDAEDLVSGRSLDCNGNGEPDECDLASRRALPSTLLLPSGRRPIAVLAADLDGDHRSDLVALGSLEEEPGCCGRHTASIHLNSGGRTFEPARKLLVPYNPVSPVAEDLDGDGDLDVAISHVDSSHERDNVLTVLQNVSPGGFSIRPPMPLPGVPASLCAADFDRDGRMDLAAAMSRTVEVRVLRNTGFVFTATSFEVSRPPAVIVSADVNGDRAPDLINAGYTTADRRGVVEVWVNDGAAAFSRLGSLQAGEEPTDMVAVDLEEDDDVDLAVVCQTSGEVLVFRNLGRGDYGEPARMRIGRMPRTLAAGDLDEDGDPDLLVGDFQVSVALVLANGGSGAFSHARSHAVKTPFDLELEDLDGDGHPDVVSPFGDGNAAAIVWGALGGRLESAESHYTGLGTAAMEAADFDADGEVDFALGSMNPLTQRGRVSILLARDGGLAPPVHYDNGGYPNHLAVLDVQGDGLPDLVSANPFEGTASVFENEGTGLETVRKVPAGSFPVFLASLDLDGDGRADVAVLNGSETGGPGGATLLLGRGDGTFARGGGFAVGPGPFALAAADLEGDGDPDFIVSGGPEGRLWSFANLGELAFELRQDLSAGQNPGYVGLADLSGDGRPDACAANLGSNDVSVYMNLGDGSLGPETRVRTGDRPRSLDIADMDGDGDEDVLVANEGSDSVSLLRNDGTGSLEPAAPLESGKQPIIVLGRDLDGDGVLEVCIGNQDALVSIIRIASVPPRSRDCDGNIVPDECEIAGGAEDANGNGLLDRCEIRFRRGDSNQSGDADLSDAIHILDHLFSREEPFACEDAADTNDDGDLDISDPIFLLSYLFGGGPPPPPPAPPDPCGVDREPLQDDPLGCESSDGC